MNKVAQIIGDKVGDIVEGAVKKTLGIEDKDEKKGGIKSWFGGDKEKEKEKDKEGIFSFGHDKKKKGRDEQKEGGFFSKVFHKDDEDEKDRQKKSGFQGLFAEGPERGAVGGSDADYDVREGEPLAVTDRDLFDDLSEVANETSKEN